MGRLMDGTEPNRLHRRLKRALTAKNISQRELGRRIGATQASVSHYVNGRQLPGATTLFKICSELDVSADWLLGLKRKEPEMNESIWTVEGDAAWRTADDCSLVARIVPVEDGTLELGILEGDTACELVRPAIRYHGCGQEACRRNPWAKSPQRDRDITFIENELDGVLSPNISDEDYLATAALDRETMRTLVVHALPICTGPNNQEVAVTLAISGPNGIEMETEHEEAALKQATRTRRIHFWDLVGLRIAARCGSGRERTHLHTREVLSFAG